MELIIVDAGNGCLTTSFMTRTPPLKVVTPLMRSLTMT